jgi:hypothetical protein
VRLFTGRSLSESERARLESFSAAGHGASVTRLKPMEGQAISGIKADLAANGFREVSPGTPNLRSPHDMEIFMHEDGGLVKIKPNGDDVQFTRFGRAGPIVSREVVIDRSASGNALTGFDNVAFKVTETGLPIPKLPSQLNHPLRMSRDDVARKAFDKAWADHAHTHPQAPPGFAQRSLSD